MLIHLIYLRAFCSQNYAAKSCSVYHTVWEKRLIREITDKHTLSRIVMMILLRIMMLQFAIQILAC